MGNLLKEENKKKMYKTSPSHHMPCNTRGRARKKDVFADHYGGKPKRISRFAFILKTYMYIYKARKERKQCWKR
jgi:hypothetical protein